MSDGFSFCSRLISPLFEDAHFLAVNKLAGVPASMEGLTSLKVGKSILRTPIDSPRFPPRHGRVSGATRRVFDKEPGPPDRLHVVQKMATTESGTVLLAKSKADANALGELLRKGGVHLVYWAVAKGEHKGSGFTKGSGLSPRRLFDRVNGSGKRNRGGTVRSQSSSDRSEDKPSSIQALLRGPTHSLLRLTLSSGRRVDPRSFLRARRLPIVGDRRGDRQSGERFAGRCFLHLAEMRFAHPFTGRRMVIRHDPPASFRALVEGKDIIEDALTVALNARCGFLMNDETNAYRLLNGAPDGVPGLVAERFGSEAVLWTYPEQFDDRFRRLERAARFYQRTLGLSAVHAKVAVKDRGIVDRDALEDTAHRAVAHEETAHPDQIGTVAHGSPESDQTSALERGEVAIKENDLIYLVRPAEGHVVGLFLDQRENRQRVRECSAGRRVLNTFAYTCSFSVAAAAGGAAETVSIDLSQRYLDWGKRNFESNGLALDQNVFVRAEVFDYLKRAKKHGRRFDLIVLDPPTFARSKRPKRVFRLADDLEALIGEAVELLDRKGLLLLNVNARQCSLAFLKTALRRGSGSRRFRIVSTPPLPPDFATDRDYSKSLWAQFDP